jgi:hypothetical protein
MSKDATPGVGILETNGYWEWACRMQDLLVYKELGDCITREGLLLAEDAEKLRDRKALALIRSHVSGALLPYIVNKESAKQVWDALKELNVRSLNARKAMLEDELSHLKKAASEGVTEYCARAQQLRLELHGAGEAVSDDRVIRALLRGLPKAFATVRETLLYQDNLTLDKVSTHLRGAEERLDQQDGDAIALKVSGKKRIRCYHCHELGHIRKYCPKLGKKQKTEADAVAMTAINECSTTAETVGIGNQQDVKVMSAVRKTVGEKSIDWVVDSGATHHILTDEMAATMVEPCKTTVLLGDGSKMKATASCTVKMFTRIGKRTVEVSLSDVLLVPNAPYNLFSVMAAMRKGIDIEGRSNSGVLLLKKQGQAVGVATPKRGLAVLQCRFRIPAEPARHIFPVKGLVAKSNAEVWHQRLGHLSYSTMAQMVRNGAVDGMNVSEEDLKAKSLEVCDVCVKAKQTAESHKASENRATAPLQRVHSDLMGPFSPVSAGGNVYLLTAMDDYSGYAAVRFLRHKSEASDNLRQMICSWERQIERKTKVVRTDRGGEYFAFDNWCKEVGIRRERTVPYTPQQNGCAERLNRTLTEKVRAMLASEKIPKKFWAEAFATAVKLYNLSPRKKMAETPSELFLGEKPVVHDWRTFGCKVYVKVPPTGQTKLGERSETGRLLGYEDGTKGWRVLLDSGKVVVRFNVKFVESGGGLDSIHDEAEHADTHDAQTEPEPEPETEAGWDGSLLETQEAPAKRVQPVRTREPSKRFKDVYTLMASAENLPDEPVSLEMALKQPDSELWRQAADEEIAALQKLNVFEITEARSDMKPLKNKWVLKRKRTSEGLIERYKARLVAKGFTQRKGVDFDEVFAPVARHATLRALLAHAAVEDLELQQIDVKTAFLNGPLKEDIYMDQPEGYDFGSNKVLKLNKALYGLKQAARAWNDRLVEVLTNNGLKVSIADASLFILECENRRNFLLVYVDDGLIAAHAEDVEKIMHALEAFDIRKLGNVKWFLSIEVVRDRAKKTVLISQSKYAHQVLEKMGMADCSPKTTPMEVNVKLSKFGDDLMEDPSKYAEAIGMLMYLATCTRPDISFTVGCLARFISAPRQEHWRRVQAMLRYLKKTVQYGLLYGGTSDDMALKGYSDSDFAADPDRRRSTGGYVFIYAKGAISWSSKLLTTVASSTMEAEYMAAAWAVKEALWLRKLMTSLSQVSGVQLMILVDNQSALALMRNPCNHARAKHIDVGHHFIRERIMRGEVAVQYCPTDQMLADGMTKALGQSKHEEMCKQLGLHLS